MGLATWHGHEIEGTLALAAKAFEHEAVRAQRHGRVPLVTVGLDAERPRKKNGANQRAVRHA